MSTASVAPRCMVPQKTPTPNRHIIVAITVACGIRDIQASHADPANK